MLDEKQTKLDKERRHALARGDSEKYARLCDALGMFPENMALYESGIEKLIKSEAMGGILEELARVHPYDLFLNEAEERGINIKEFSAHTDTKARLLKKYFPEKFEKDGEQSLEKYKATQIGKIFNQIVQYAHKVIRKNSKKGSTSE
jgi:hypothetical protein